MKTKILALLSFMAIVAIQSQLIAFAAEPPGLSSPFSDPPSLGDDDDTDPPSLGGDDDTDPPSLGDGTPPAADDTSDDDDSANGVSGSGYLPVIDGDDDDDDDTGSGSGSGSGSTGGTYNSSGSTGGISETGPAVGFLLFPSLVLGYGYKKLSKK